MLMVALPGKLVYGETTPNGTRWLYKINSLLAFFVSGAMYLFASFYLGWFSPAIFNENWLSVIVFSNIFAFTAVILSYVKGHLWPSVGPNGRTDVNICGNMLGDMYKVWGVVRGGLHCRCVLAVNLPLCQMRSSWRAVPLLARGVWPSEFAPPAVADPGACVCLRTGY